MANEEPIVENKNVENEAPVQDEPIVETEEPIEAEPTVETQEPIKIRTEIHSVKLIGVGGIGTSVLNWLARHLIFLDDCELTLVDGDEFEPKNVVRQDFDHYGNKATVKADELAAKFETLSVRDVPEFVTPENIDDIIEEGDVIFSCVDNHATRKLLSDHCQKLDNIVLISGGNRLTDGNVQVYLRRDGQDVTRPLTDLHPEIANPADRSPGEMSCEERAAMPGSRQIMVANAGAAWLMYLAFWLLEDGQIDKLGEFYFDLLTPTKVQAHERKPPIKS